ncbi:AAA family ATPase [Shinella zoogloeoides]|uniref:AAA family ATPase n=1 Tax=Shinella zoogloeoides TaxID=352475 RepID=UPI0028B1A558|nr:AAA family ATPase [Shinella zoogloeoides]
MKNIKRHGNDIAFPELIAYCGVAAAMRPFSRCHHYAIALVVEAWDERSFYLRAANTFMYPDDRDRWRTKGTPFIFEKTKPTASTENVLDELKNPRAIILFNDRDTIPPEIEAAFDAVVQVPPASTRQIKGAVRWRYGAVISDKEAGLLATQKWSRLQLMLRPGRAISRVLSGLAKIADQIATVEVDRRQDDANRPRLDDLHGYGEAKTWGLDLAHDLADWKEGKIAWNDVDRGLLLSGPPGVGKTAFALALGRTCGVPVILGSAARWQARGHLGDLLKAMRKAFDDAKRNTPSILFIDEIDAFGNRESVGFDHANYVRQVINGLLECLDGAEKREGVVVIGACNHPEFLDAAVKRPGRLDRHIVIPYPDREARIAIAEGYLGQAMPEGMVEEFAKRSVGATGAVIEQWIREARRITRRVRRQFQATDVLEVLPPARKLSDDMLKCVAVHELGHAVVSVILDAEKLHSVSIQDSELVSVGRQSLGGAIFESDPLRRRTRRYYLNQIATYMGGIAAEVVFFGDHADGAGGKDMADLNVATNLALVMEWHLGMGSSFVSFGELDFKRLDSMKFANSAVLTHVENILHEQFDRAKAIVEKHRGVIALLSKRLIEEVRQTVEEMKKAALVARRRIRNR